MHLPTPIIIYDMETIAKTTKRVIFALITLTLLVSCTKEDDIEDIFVERNWSLTRIVERTLTSYNNGKKYSIEFFETTFEARMPNGSTIHGNWSADGSTREFKCSNMRTSGNISGDSIARKIERILTGARKYSGDSHWLKIMEQENIYLMFGN